MKKDYSFWGKSPKRLLRANNWPCTEVPKWLSSILNDQLLGFFGVDTLTFHKGHDGAAKRWHGRAEKHIAFCDKCRFNMHFLGFQWKIRRARGKMEKPLQHLWVISLAKRWQAMMSASRPDFNSTSIASLQVDWERLSKPVPLATSLSYSEVSKESLAATPAGRAIALVNSPSHEVWRKTDPNLAPARPFHWHHFRFYWRPCSRMPL